MFSLWTDSIRRGTSKFQIQLCACGVTFFLVKRLLFLPKLSGLKQSRVMLTLSIIIGLIFYATHVVSLHMLDRALATKQLALSIFFSLSMHIIRFILTMVWLMLSFALLLFVFGAQHFLETICTADHFFHDRTQSPNQCGKIS